MRTRLLKIATYKPGKPIEELQRELGLKRICKLASNENPYPPSPKVQKALRKALPRINRYPESSLFYLRRKISQLLDVHEDEIVFGNGSDELIVFAVRSLVSPGDEILTAKPTFLIYKISAMVEGIRIREIPMKDFRYDLKTIRSSMTENTKLVFIANPDNPTGSYVSREEVAWFVNNLPEGVVVFFDEAYYEFARDREDFPSTLEFVKAGKPIVVSRTFSKYYGLAGLRLGYAVGRKDLIDLMNRVREPFNVNLLAQEAGLAALESEDYYRKVYRTIVKERERVKKVLGRLGFECLDSVTNFLLVRVGSEAGELVDYLLRRGIIVRHMKAWGLEEFIRVTIGRPDENRWFVNEVKRWKKSRR